MNKPDALRALALLLARYPEKHLGELEMATYANEFVVRVESPEKAAEVLEKCVGWYTRFPNVAQLRAVMRDVRGVPVELPESTSTDEEAVAAKQKMLADWHKRRAGSGTGQVKTGNGEGSFGPAQTSEGPV